MKKKMIGTLLSLSCAFSILSGCAEAAQPAKQGPEKPSQSVSEQMQTGKHGTHGTDHIDFVIKENHQVHARVYTPNIAQCCTYKIEFMDFDAEKVAQILAPEDKSAYTTERDDKRGRTNLTTAEGNEVIANKGRIMFYADSQNRGKEIDEIGNLIEDYAQTHEDAQDISLDFMTCEEAIESGKQILRDLGINLQPEVQISCGLSHEQLLSYQQEMIAADAQMEYPRYDPFGNVYRLGDLTEDSDSYFLKFGFSCENIPVLGYSNEPNFEMKNNAFPPMGSSAEMVISRQGLQKFQIYGACRVLESSEPVPVLSAEDAIAKYAEKWRESLQPVPEEKWEVRHLYLEYVPVYTDEGGILTPYWCIVPMWQSLHSEGKDAWSILGGTRYNAITGGDFAYGQ